MEPTRGQSPDDPAVDQFLRIVPGVPVALIAWDSGMLIDANKAMATLLGVPLESLGNRSILDFHVMPEQRDLFLRQVERAGDDGAETDLELRREDGTRLWVRMSARRILYRGSPALIAISRDITAIKEQARQLADVERRLARHTSDLTTAEHRIKERAAEAANRAKSLFLTHMSHELRSPLNSILGFSEMVRDMVFGRDQADKYREYGGYIHQAGTHLLALIDDILDLAKVEAGKLVLKPARFDLGELFDECARMMRPMVERRGLALAVLPTEPGLTLTADRLRTKQMIVNLLSNALKFTPAGGRVELSAQRMRDGGTAITVSDSGVGMTEDQVTLALEPFGRVEGSAVSDPTGTGLGLPIVKKLIEAHGGRLQITSELNRGTVARLLFPAQG
jgi:PAS domain S-box-containing protein